jgi:pimeloyl-ACP methyl ester carboxylesterase
MNTAVNWQQRVGNQRDWVWRGWQIRYTYIRSQCSSVQRIFPQPQDIEDKKKNLSDKDFIIPSQNQPNTTPLILLHGFGASIGHWRHNLEVLGEHHTVYALDMLGFGASEKAPVNYRVELWVEQVYEFWQTFIRQPVILVGNSIGSLIALVAAAVHPDMVQGIVMMSLPDPTLEQEALPTFLHPVVRGIKSIIASPLLLKALFRFLKRPGLVRRWASLAYTSQEAITDELIEILAGPPQDRGSTRAFIALFKASIGVDFSPSVKKILPNLTIPMLLIWGQKDRFVPPILASEFARYNDKLELLYLEDVGHCPHDESPEQVNKAILDWIQRNK